ncbi:MAG: CbiX/SirB N-terminal domain-containing protein [Planctomycetota bacterium]
MRSLAVPTAVLSMLLSALVLAAHRYEPEHQGESPSTLKKIGVLLVNHGSRSSTWRQALLDLEREVTEPLRRGGIVKEVRTAFMEYTEPSIATQLKAFDASGYTDVIIVPLFLTVSTHSFDDIPTIIGAKEDAHSLEALKLEKIERYTPRARVRITPLLDFTSVLQENVLNRVKKLSRRPSEEGLVLIAYGDQTYSQEWSDLLKKVADFVKHNTGITDYSYGWCGHVARYSPDATTAAIREVLTTKTTAIVIPVLVARDEMFQVQIIADGINKIPDAKSKVRYRPDAILPDAHIERWVIQIASTYADKAHHGIAMD